MFEKSFEILNFGSNTMHLKFTILTHFGTHFTGGKPKVLLKTKVFGKTASLGVSNNVSPRSQKNHRFLAKLDFWTQIYKLPPGAASKGYQKFSHSHIAYKRTIHLCQVSASLLVSNLPRRNSNVFLVQDPIEHFFLEEGSFFGQQLQ